MRSTVCPALTIAAIVHGLSTDPDRRRGQRCTVLTHPVSLIHRGISVQINRATSLIKHLSQPTQSYRRRLRIEYLPQSFVNHCLITTA